MNAALALTRARLTVLVVAIGAFTACSRSPLEGPPDSRLKYNEVSTLATNAASANGFNVADYNQPSLRFEKSDGKREWLVYFQLKGNAPPGGHFLVVVDDDTSKVTVHRGE